MEQHNTPRAGIILCGGHSRRMGVDKAWLQAGGETLLQRTVRTVRRCVDRVVVAARPGQELPALPNEVRIVRDALPNCGPLAGMLAAFEEVRDEASCAFVCACDHPLLSAELICELLRRFDNARSRLTDRSSEGARPLQSDISAKVHTPRARNADGQDRHDRPGDIGGARHRPSRQTIRTIPNDAIAKSARGNTSATAREWTKSQLNAGTYEHSDPTGTGVLLPVYNDRLQPLLSVYSLDTTQSLRNSLEVGERRVETFALSCAPRYVNAEDLRHIDRDLGSFLNVNTPDEWERIVTGRRL